MKTCTKCGIEKGLAEFYVQRASRDGRQAYCKVCSKASVKVYQNTIASKEYRRKYAASEKGKEHQRNYNATEKHKEALRVYQLTEKYKEAHRRHMLSEKRKVYERKYATTKKFKKQQAAYLKTKRGAELHRQRSHKRRALEAGSVVGPIDEAAIYAACDNKCVYCGSKERLELDHVVAIAAGGSHTQDNLTLACQSCNRSKGAKPLDEWLATRLTA